MTSPYLTPEEQLDNGIKGYALAIRTLAQAIEAFGQDPKGLGAKHESAVGPADAPRPDNSHTGSSGHPAPNSGSERCEAPGLMSSHLGGAALMSGAVLSQRDSGRIPFGVGLSSASPIEPASGLAAVALPSLAQGE